MAEPPPFSFSTRLGIVFIVESHSLSAIAVASLLLYILFNAIVYRRWPMETHTHYYFVNLLISDLVQALGGLISIKWIMEANVTEGPICTTQGIIKQMGNVGVALTTLAIAVHTLLVLVFHLRTRPETALIIIGLIWTFIGLSVGIGAGIHKGYYGNTGYWCWISSRFPRERIGLEYLWMWFTCLCNIVIYVFLALVIKGYIIVEQRGIRMAKRNERMTQATSQSGDLKKAKNVAMNLLFYPAVYLATTLPVAVVRWMAFTGFKVPFPGTVFGSVLFASSGLLNVILYTATRPKLIPHRPPTSKFDGATSSTSSWAKSTLSSNHSRDSGPWDEESGIRIEVSSTRHVDIAPPMPTWSPEHGRRRSTASPPTS